LAHRRKRWRILKHPVWPMKSIILDLSWTGQCPWLDQRVHPYGARKMVVQLKIYCI
jgi:hypothetical protein